MLWGGPTFTVRKSERSKQAYAVNVLAWNNDIGLRCYFVGLRVEAMTNRDSWGYWYHMARGEI